MLCDKLLGYVSRLDPGATQTRAKLLLEKNKADLNVAKLDYEAGAISRYCTELYCIVLHYTVLYPSPGRSSWPGSRRGSGSRSTPRRFSTSSGVIEFYCVICQKQINCNTPKHMLFFMTDNFVSIVNT